ncbi:MAG TPA: type II toxin-antitoxin system prevent-host-death family antitoxin [Dermatophilaceae bacterium]|jgi:prevent-host-death family protein|nr:type II toxin-antitoxin system prevent-host-death family antitoxin [Actinomycetales bacterium]HMT31377.1 type II toxin-antitoxin system prevent-host-death family antitoxin [Dermatophilaceae bacterium]HMT89433.1 type II toxin-antitoxin system prevent-host-death family antitoxin [Dermatophilaceae bacterium]
MRTVTATQASRGFAALLDEVERGGRVRITRGGRTIATISPATAGNGAAVVDLLTRSGLEAGFADDVEAARSLPWEGPAWVAD